MFKINYNYLKVMGLLMLVVFLFAFSNQRNNQRLLAPPTVKFLGEGHHFITNTGVSKLLIQNNQTLTDQPKDIIDLDRLEVTLNNNPMIKNAEVYISVEGKVTAEIEQKRPIARVLSNTSYYIDDEGGVMPLSANYTARVPIVTGNVKSETMEHVFKFAKVVDGSTFLKKHVIEIHQNANNTIAFKVRKSNFIVQLGKLDNLEKKINNFKAFYQKALKDSILETYKTVNLKFDKQVICTKK